MNDLSYNPEEHPIRVTCTGADSLPIDSILEFQGDLKKLTKNNRTKVVNSICEEGFMAPVFIWEDQGDNRILDGHQRIKALIWMRQKGWDIPLLPVVYIEAADEKEARRKLLKITSQYGEFNTEELERWLEEAGEDISDSIRLVDTEMQMLLDMKAPGETAGNDEVPEQVPPITKNGDIWELGSHRIICGDSTSPDVISALTQGVLVDLLVTDPPYNVDYVGKTKDALKIENDKMEGGAFREFLYDAFIAASGSMKPGASYYIWHADSEGYNFRGACDDALGQVRQCLIWKKNSMVMGRQDYHWQHEPCLYGWKEGAAHLWAADRKQTTILEFDRPSRNAEHPTMKPVALIQYCIENNTKGGDIVLDTFLGSGTSIIASEKCGRICYGVELDPHYCDVDVHRYKAWCETNDRECVIKLNGEVWNG